MMSYSANSPISSETLRDFQTWVFSFLEQNQIGLWLGYACVLGSVVYGLRRFAKTDVGARLRRTIVDEVLTNWRLALLGLTSLSLALASGWTTWDGMTHFTSTPVLSFLITLGIQGVMLVTAWLIGESFAVGLAGSDSRDWMIADWVLAGIVVLIFGAGFYAATMALLSGSTMEAIDGLLHPSKSELQTEPPGSNLKVLTGLSVAGVLTMLIVSQREVFEPYLRGTKVVLKNLPIWLMFLACVVTSVFFSFDSLFSTIFPAEERERAARLRTTNQVAGIIADLGGTIARRQSESVDALLTSPEWAAYEARLNDIVAIERAAPDALAAQTRRELEDSQATRASLEETKASAKSQVVRLAKRKDELTADVNKLKDEQATLSGEVDRLKSESFKKDSEILAKRAEADAEAGGVGGTLKAGRGPVWQQRQKELDDLGKLKAINDSELTDRMAELKKTEDAIAANEAELAQIDGELGKLTGQRDVADRQIATLSKAMTDDKLATALGSAGAPGPGTLENAVARFRQVPDRATFEALQQDCTGLVTVFDQVPNLKAMATQKAARCDPSSIGDKVGRVFALDEGLALFKQQCVSADSLPQSSVDALLKFGEDCVQASGLAGQDTALFRGALNSIGLNRDDQAHRFVVSWNAFQDGNRLAYLALAIAIALDGLVFMAGLFGANAVSSPLARLPSERKRSAADLEATMLTALRPDVYGHARLILNAMHPLSEHEGFVSEIRLTDHNAQSAHVIRRILSSAAQLGAVRADTIDDTVFEVRGELTEFLSKACERELRTSEDVRRRAEEERLAIIMERDKFEDTHQQRTQREREQEATELHEDRALWRKARRLEPVLISALIGEDMENSRDISSGAYLVLSSMDPVDSSAGFSSEIELTGLPMPDADRIRCVLNAAAMMGAVQIEHENGAGRYGLDAQSARTSKRYLIRPELTLCLSDIRRRIASEALEAAAHTSRRLFSWNRKKTTTPPEPATQGTTAPIVAESVPAVSSSPKREAGERRNDFGGRRSASPQSLRTVTLIGTQTAANDGAVLGTMTVNRIIPTDTLRDAKETSAANHPLSDKSQGISPGLREAHQPPTAWEAASEIESLKSETDHSDKSDDA
jgi:hypothetical protein